MARSGKKKQNQTDIPAIDDTTLENEKPGPETAGQAGDIQGLSNVPLAGSESVAELAQEGQFFEAAVISGVEDAPDADVSEVKTKEVPEDDVPPEYLDDPDLIPRP